MFTASWMGPSILEAALLGRANDICYIGRTGSFAACSDFDLDIRDLYNLYIQESMACCSEVCKRAQTNN